ncbi:MAG TPA: hypothetical protein VHT50_00020 [Mycobacterium sp.]|nr:hypothetical protein [Mycobacterium sp.]
MSEIAGPVDRTGSCATRHSSGWRDSNPKTHKDFPNDMPSTHADTVNADLLVFLRS